MNLVRIIRENKILNKIYNKSTALVEIVPFYLVEEYLSDDFKLDVDLEDMETYLPDPSDMITIAENSEVPQSEADLHRRLAGGCICLAVKSRGHICAYSWCNLRNVGYRGLIIPLKDNEAYLFDARTFRAYRGKNVAPYVRHQLYSHLKNMGRSKFYSASSYFNKAAMIFKVKLGARPVKLYLGLKLFNKYSWNILLKNYDT